MGTSTVIAVVALAVLIAGVIIYNRLVSLRNRARNAWSQIDVQLQRRYELIPNLVETARAYLEHERETLTAVTEARNGAEAQRRAARDAGESVGSAAGVGGGAAGIAALASAEAGVTGALGRLNLVMEAYPDLKADTRLSELHEDLASTENRVGFARQAYSDAVMRLNTAIEQFPAVIVARLFRFEEAELFEADSATVREPVRVSFARANV